MATIDGLASGLDTTSLIQQLMQLERVPQARLQVALETNNFAIDTLKKLNTKFLAIKTGAEAFTTSTGWHPAMASSSDEAVVVATASAGAMPANLTFEVTQLAAAGSAISQGSVGAMTDAVATGATISVTKGSDTRSIAVGDGTLGEVVNAINAEKMGVTATAIQVSPGEYKLQLSSTTTGADTVVSVAAGSFDPATLGDTDVLTAAADATLEVGGTNSYTVTRPSNTMSDLVEGVTLTLKSLGTTTVEVKTDTEAMTANVKKLIANVNGTLAQIKSDTSYDVNNHEGGVLTGDGMVRGLQISLLGTFSQGTTVDGVTYSPGAFGITVERDGTIMLDEAKFAEAYAEDPALVEAVLGGNGLAGRLESVAERATAPDKGVSDIGLITSSIKSREGRIKDMNQSIEAWDNRLALREQVLRRQFVGLETALAQAQAQGQWLSGQLAGLQANMSV